MRDAGSIFEVSHPWQAVALPDTAVPASRAWSTRRSHTSSGSPLTDSTTTSRRVADPGSPGRTGRSTTGSTRRAPGTKAQGLGRDSGGRAEGWGGGANSSRVGSSGEAGYAACKGGLVAFSKTLAREHARHGITVNVVCPGPTDTALLASVTEGAPNPEKLVEAFTRAIPLGRLGQPDDLAGAIAFLGSEDAAFVTGQVLSVSGGLTMNG